MSLIALVLSVLVAAFGALGVVSPAKMLSVVRRFDCLTGLYAAAAFRVVLGVSLFYAAPTSHAPELIRIVGIAIFIAGITLPFLGLRRFRKVLSWWTAQEILSLRIWAGMALGIGLFLTYAVVT